MIKRRCYFCGVVKQPKKLTPAQLKEENEKLKKLLENGVRCIVCGVMKDKSKFYINTHPQCQCEVGCVCKECARKIALRTDSEGIEHEATKESCIEVLKLLNKPFLNLVWDASVQESQNLVAGKIKTNIWTAYIKNIAMVQYVGMTFFDSDMFKKNTVGMDRYSMKDPQTIDDLQEDVRATYDINKKTTLRFLGYDPFENEPIEEQPILYAKLVSYFDDSVRDDGLKLEAVIEIVQSFKDIKTINDAISKYKKQLGENPAVIATIKSLADTKQKMINSALALAKDNGISVNHNNSKSKGAGTLSGIIKEMSEMNLDDIEINTFDYETGAAISQIMEANFQNQMKQLNPDENDWEREVYHQATLLHSLQKERDNAVEYCRLLRKENKDLKDFLKERNIIDEALNVIDE